MTHEQLLHDRAEIIYELGEARRNWMGRLSVQEIAMHGWESGDFSPINGLLDEYNDLVKALSHGEVTDNGPVPHQGYEPHEYDGA
jgi:hypothetical protein